MVKPGALPEGIQYKEMTLLMQSDTSLRVYFTLASGKTIGDYVFKLGETGKQGTVYQPKPGTGSHAGQYYVEISNIPAAELGQSYTISVNDAEFNNVSALSYACLALQSAKASNDLKNTAKALYEYYQAATVYFAN